MLETCRELPIHGLPLDKLNELGNEVTPEERCRTVKSTLPTNPEKGWTSYEQSISKPQKLVTFP